jgi:hypothetical protein
MRFLIVLALVFLCAVGGFGYGVAVGLYRIWPYQQIRLIKDEAQFLLSDLRGGLDRQIVRSESASRTDFRPLDLGTPVTGKSMPRISQSGPAGGMTAVLGSFEFEAFGHAVLLLGPEGEVLHRWDVDEASIDDPERRGPMHKFPHGLVVLPDGSILVNFDGGVSLQRFDACSASVWSLNGKYHHLMGLDEAGENVWTLVNEEPEAGAGDDLALRREVQRISVEDGTIERRFTMRDVIDANPGLDVLGVRQLEEVVGGYTWDLDAIHDNDIEPLPQAYAATYPMFAAGDLLISLRSLNAVIVLDPETLEIKWFTMGWMRRQHDPDWEADGSITIFDNNMHRDASRILRFDPASSGPPEVILEGRDYDFYTWIRGNHETTDAGTILVTSPQQGRVFEVDEDGEVVFELLNVHGDSMNQRLVLSNAVRLPRDYFNEGVFDSCAQ